ncbi:MAG: SPOR domain-containing protein [bacterium]|nr:SPOR domain-containing protein [bacterium]
MNSREQRLRMLIGVFVLTAALLVGAAPARAQSTGERYYSVVILQGKSQAEAEQGQRILEGWISPVFTQAENGLYDVLYGKFATDAEAVGARQQLDRQGIFTRGIKATLVAQPPAVSAPAPAAAQRWTVVVQPFNDWNQARELADRLRAEGYSPVNITRVGRSYEVTVGDYTLDEATTTLGRFRNDNFLMARLQQASAAAPQPAPAVPTAPAQATPPPIAEAQQLLPGDLLDDFKKLSPQQQKELLNQVMLQGELRQGNPLVSEIIDIQKNLKTLDSQVQTLLKTLKDERTSETLILTELNNLEKDAENQARSGAYDQAILNLTKVLDIDKDNRYGHRLHAQSRITAWKAKLSGESYPGQSEDKDRTYQANKRAADELAKSQSIQDLQDAIQYWINSKQLDPVKYGSAADNAIRDLKVRIDSINQREAKAQADARQLTQYMLLGLGVGLVLVVLLVIWIWARGRKRHAELMRKVQEITSIRPMREITGGGGAAVLPAAGAAPDSTESDIFTPRVPGKTAAVLDPLGGLAEAEAEEKKAPRKPDKKEARKEAKKEAKKPEPVAAKVSATADIDSLFGGGEPAAEESEETRKIATPVDDMGFDDIFGSSDKTPEATTVESAPMAAAADPFSSLFGGSKTDESAPAEEESAPREKPAPIAERPAPKAKAPVAEPEEVETSPISFDDLLSVGSARGEQTESVSPTATSEDLLSMFDTAIEDTGASQPAGKTPAAAPEDRLKESPFESLFGGAGESAEGPSPEDEDTEIPAIKLDMPDFTDSSHGKEPSSDDEKTAPSFDLPTFNFDDVSGATPPSEVMVETAVGCNLDFEADAVGQKPSGWEGDYPFARLEVQSETPPKGSHQYLRFVKREGVGKALYTCRFPGIGGKVGIEFDMRCNDKNKFLLGFYFERDGDFQQSIHTKILRSEAQTTPTIHMQGESAPYLLGSWAHIKYIVDLGEGTLNGYIDSTHVARDLKLINNPELLNTLSIRDNINTTGELLLDNIKVYAIK